MLIRNYNHDKEVHGINSKLKLMHAYNDTTNHLMLIFRIADRITVVYYRIASEILQNIVKSQY